MSPHDLGAKGNFPHNVFLDNHADRKGLQQQKKNSRDLSEREDPIQYKRSFPKGNPLGLYSVWPGLPKLILSQKGQLCLQQETTRPHWLTAQRRSILEASPKHGAIDQICGRPAQKVLHQVPASDSTATAELCFTWRTMLLTNVSSCAELCDLPSPLQPNITALQPNKFLRAPIVHVQRADVRLKTKSIPSIVYTYCKLPFFA